MSFSRSRTEPGLSRAGTPKTGVKPVSCLAVNALFGGAENFERDLVDGMNASLANIKAAAEQA
jgi:hypothetical protein